MSDDIPPEPSIDIEPYGEITITIPSGAAKHLKEDGGFWRAGRTFYPDMHHKTDECECCGSSQYEKLELGEFEIAVAIKSVDNDPAVFDYLTSIINHWDALQADGVFKYDE